MIMFQKKKKGMYGSQPAQDVSMTTYGSVAAVGRTNPSTTPTLGRVIYQMNFEIVIFFSHSIVVENQPSTFGSSSGPRPIAAANPNPVSMPPTVTSPKPLKSSTSGVRSTASEIVSSKDIESSFKEFAKQEIGSMQGT